MSLLDLDGIDAYYGESHILRRLSMQVEEGEICALLGRNGAGKTTTLRCIAGARPPEVHSGSVRLQGEDITDRSTEDISALGVSLVPEERRVFSGLTVAENLHLASIIDSPGNTFGRDIGVTEGGASEVEIYGTFPRLDERRNQRAGTLSGGEQQMLAVARALRQGTEVMLLDEPYEGLAPRIIRDVEDAVAEINDAGTTVLLVEQNAVAAMEIADRCYVVDKGTIVFEGTAAELREDETTRQEYLGV